MPTKRSLDASSTNKKVAGPSSRGKGDRGGDVLVDSSDLKSQKSSKPKSGTSKTKKMENKLEKPVGEKHLKANKKEDAKKRVTTADEESADEKVVSASKKSKGSKEQLSQKTPPRPASSTSANASTGPKLTKSKGKEAVKPAAQSDSDEGENSEEEEELHLHGFSSDSDSSDDDGLDEPAPIDVAKLPTIAKDDATVKRKLQKAKANPTDERGVLYLGRIPHGFYEDQMKAYFSQFGDVTRLRISRNKKTGKSKHYGFIEFDSSSVAQIVSETMDNYLLMGHLLKCKVIPKDKVHPELWVGANRKWRKVPQDRIARLQHNKERSSEEKERAESRLLRRQEEKKRKIAAAGIDYNFDAVAYKRPKMVET